MAEPCLEKICDNSSKRKNLLNTQLFEEEPFPQTKVEYGKSTWEFLHTTCIYYQPSKESKEGIKNIIKGLS